MSASEEWANDAERRRGCPLLPLAVLAAVLVVVLSLTACRTPAAPSAPTTGVQPQPVATVMPSAVQVKP